MTAGSNRGAWLAWYVEAGADEAIGEAPVDRFAHSGEKSAAPSPNPPAQPSVPPPARLVARDALEATARELALSADTVEVLARTFAAFDVCDLKLTA